MKRAVLIGTAVAVITVASGVSFYLRSQPDLEYSGVRELVADLERNGVECDGLMVSEPDQTERAGAEFGFCYISDDGEENQMTSVTIHVYHELDLIEPHVQRHLDSRGDTPNNFTALVRDENWIVEGYSEERIGAVQEAIGGSIE